jgi:hypothetical protein
MNKYLQDIVSKAVAHVDVQEIADGVVDGLMKTHEFVGHAGDVVADHAANLAADMQDGIMKVSMAVEDYAGLLAAINKVHGFGEPGTPVQDDSPFTKFVNYSTSNTVEWSTRDDKIKYILNYFGLKDNENTREVYTNYDDEQLDAVLEIIRKYQNNK